MFFAFPAVALAVALAAPSAPEKAMKESAVYAGLAAKLKPVGFAQGDLDGDGSAELVAAFAPKATDADDEDEPGGGERGAILVLTRAGGKLRLAWCGLFESSWPEELSVEGGTIRFTSHKGGGAAPVKAELIWGKDFRFFGDPLSPFAGAKVTASSSAPMGKPENLIDGDPDTVWAENVEGTGVDERVTVELAKPVALGMVGVLGGDARSMKGWRESNRVHRAELVVELEADRGDASAGVTFSDLGVSSGGDHHAMSFPDARRMKWQEVARKAAVSVRFDITSVYLGEKHDDTYLAEISFAELVPDPVAAPVAGGAKPGVPLAPKKRDDADAADRAAAERLANPGSAAP